MASRKFWTFERVIVEQQTVDTDSDATLEDAMALLREYDWCHQWPDHNDVRNVESWEEEE